MVESLAEALPIEIDRVRKLQDLYKSMRSMPNVIVEPAIMMMEVGIKEGIDALGSGDTIRMIRAHVALKDYEE